MKNTTEKKQKVHFVAGNLLEATNPVRVNLVGCGGTGSQVLWGLARIDQALRALQHPGLSVRVFDGDTVSSANVGRGFTEAEVGLNKAGLLVNRINRGCSTNWKAAGYQFSEENLPRIGAGKYASITISCVDKVPARFEITAILKAAAAERHSWDTPLYHMDFGNSVSTGQVILSTVQDIEQPSSKKYVPVAALPMITDEFGSLLQQSEKQDDTPSCSLAEALSRQDLFINPSLAIAGCSLLWNMLRKGMTPYRGFFHNLWDFREQPIKIG